MSSLKKLLFGLFLLGLVFTPLSVAFAVDTGLDATAGAAGLGSGSPYPSSVPVLIGNVIGTALSMIAVIFFVLMVYGGFLWMTAHGDSGQIDKAKDTIIAAVIGIIVVLAAYAITNFVFDAVNGTKAAPTTPAGGGQPSYCINPASLPGSCSAPVDCTGNISFPDQASCNARLCELSAGTAGC